MERRVTPEKRTVNYYENVEEQVPYKFTVLERRVTPEKRKVTYYENVEEQVPYKLRCSSRK